MASTFGGLPHITTAGSPEFWHYPGGLGYDQNMALAADIWGTANLIHYYPFVLSADFLVRNFILWQNAAGISNGRLGVYNEAGTLVGEGNGTINLNTGGANFLWHKPPSATFTLTKGNLYYMAVTVSGAGAWTGVSTGTSAETDAFDILGCKQEAGSGTLPATATFADFATDEVIYYAGICTSTEF